MKKRLNNGPHLKNSDLSLCSLAYTSNLLVQLSTNFWKQNRSHIWISSVGPTSRLLQKFCCPQSIVIARLQKGSSTWIITLFEEWKNKLFLVLTISEWSFSFHISHIVKPIFKLFPARMHKKELQVSPCPIPLCCLILQHPHPKTT